MLETLIQKIERFLNGDYDPLVFSHEAPEFLCKRFHEIKAENEGAAILLNEDLPDICDIYERGDDPTELRERVKELYEKVTDLI